MFYVTPTHRKRKEQDHIGHYRVLTICTWFWVQTSMPHTQKGKIKDRQESLKRY